jgi:hypothetical protein
MSDPTPPAARASVRPWWVPTVRSLLALLSTLIFAGVLFAPAFVPKFVVDGDLKGAAIIQWGLVMGWYFGSSAGSHNKDAAISAMSKGPGQ